MTDNEDIGAAFVEEFERLLADFNDMRGEMAAIREMCQGAMRDDDSYKPHKSTPNLVRQLLDALGEAQADRDRYARGAIAMEAEVERLRAERDVPTCGRCGGRGWYAEKQLSNAHDPVCRPCYDCGGTGRLDGDA